MNNPTRKITSTKPSTHKSGNKTPRDPRRLREFLHGEELGNYSSNRQVDPWRGQIMQLSWEYCV